ANVRDPVAQHGYALDPDAEGEARVALRIDPAVLEDAGMDHAAAPDLEPTGGLADATARPAAVVTRAADAPDVHLGARLDEGEVARAEPHGGVLAVETLGERREYPLEFGEADPLVHEEALDLVEHRRVGDVVVSTVHGAATHDGHRRAMGGHLPHLHAAR